jgi:feruloyl esterase
MLQARLPGVQVLTATEVEGALPPVERVVPSWEGAARDVGAPELAHLPPFCRVIAKLTPVPKSNITVEIWLPRQWNGKLLGIGNHGFAGEFERANMAMGMGRGYAVVATDGGHSLKDSPEGQWLAGNEVITDDFAWRSTHEMTVAAKALVLAHYGDRARLSYFFGCSNGGRQALREAQQFPTDYDGIIAGGSAIDWTRFMASTLVQYQSGWLSTGGHLSQAKVDLAHKAAVAACDRLDGVADGVIADPQRCAWKPRMLQCKIGADTSACFTPAEVAAISRVESPIRDPRTGKVLYPGMTPGSEALWLSPTGQVAETFNRHTLSYYRDIVLGDPSWTPEQAKTADVAQLIRKSEAANSLASRPNSTSPDLSAFRKRGGKLIQYHGWNDLAMAPGFNPQYYGEVVDLQPGADKLASTQEFYRLFMAPGMGHCRGGEGPINFGGLDHRPSPTIDADHDILEALDRWVDKKAAPETIIATEFDAKGPLRQMPLCAYPKVATYVSGDVKSASSFQCKAPRPRARS